MLKTVMVIIDVKDYNPQFIEMLKAQKYNGMVYLLVHKNSMTFVLLLEEKEIFDMFSYLHSLNLDSCGFSYDLGSDKITEIIDSMSGTDTNLYRWNPNWGV